MIVCLPFVWSIPILVRCALWLKSNISHSFIDNVHVNMRTKAVPFMCISVFFLRFFFVRLFLFYYISLCGYWYKSFVWRMETITRRKTGKSITIETFSYCMVRNGFAFCEINPGLCVFPITMMLSNIIPLSSTYIGHHWNFYVHRNRLCKQLISFNHLR